MLIKVNVYAKYGVYTFLVDKSLDGVRNVIINKAAKDEQDKAILRLITDNVGYNYCVDSNILYTPVEKTHIDIILLDDLQLVMMIEYYNLIL